MHAGVVSAATTLVDLFDVSLDSDPEYQSAVAANLAAQELTPQARSFLLPNLSAGGSKWATTMRMCEGPLERAHRQHRLAGLPAS